VIRFLFGFYVSDVAHSGGVESKLGPLGTAAIYCPIVPAPGDCEDGEFFGGMKIGRGNRSTRRKPAPAPLCPPKIPLDQTRDQTRAAAVGSQRLTASAMARPTSVMLIYIPLLLFAANYLIFDTIWKDFIQFTVSYSVYILFTISVTVLVLLCVLLLKLFNTLVINDVLISHGVECPNIIVDLRNSAWSHPSAW
jgi:hypothetical protein